MTHDTHHLENKTSLGTWLYLMSDCLLFASLFATFAVLEIGTATGAAYFSLSLVLLQTMLLLVSSLFSGFMLLSARRDDVQSVFVWGTLTALLGTLFLAFEISEFRTLLHEGISWQTSAYWSAFFTLVGTHGAHIFGGLILLGVIGVSLYLQGLTSAVRRHLFSFALFWHFLDIVWVCLFTFVYLAAFIV